MNKDKNEFSFRNLVIVVLTAIAVLFVWYGAWNILDLYVNDANKKYVYYGTLIIGIVLVGLLAGMHTLTTLD